MSGTGLRHDIRETIEAAALGSLFRAELAASGVYHEAIREIERDAESPALALHGIARSHMVLADELRAALLQRGSRVPPAVGAGGIWAAWWERVANVAPGSPAPFLEALQEGERLALGLAFAAMGELGEATGAYVRYRLAPALETNLELLAELRTLEALSRAERRGDDESPDGSSLPRAGGTERRAGMEAKD